MNVLMVPPSYYPIKGGAESMVRDLAIKLQEAGINVDIMTFNMSQKWNTKWRYETVEVDGIKVIRIPALNWFPTTHSPRITLGINVIPGFFTSIMKRYEIIHFHEAEFSFPFFSSLIQKPKIMHVHGIDYDFYKRYYFSRLILNRVVNRYISITREISTQLTELGICRTKIDYLPNGIDADLFCPKGAREDNLLLYVGRLHYMKGAHVLLQSLRFLRTSICLVIIGPQDLDSKSHFDLLTKFKEENTRGKHRIIYLGALERAEIIDWYRRATVLIVPSFREGLPVAILESLACETPVIASAVGGVPDIIKSNENGLLVPARSPLALAEAIQLLLDNKAFRMRLGREGRKRVLKDFSLNSTTKGLKEIYEKMLCGQEQSNTVGRK